MADIGKLLKQLKESVDKLNSFEKTRLNTAEALQIAERLESHMVTVEGALGDRLVGNDAVIKQSGFLEESRRPGLLDLLRVTFEEALAPGTGSETRLALEQYICRVYFCVLRALLIGTINTKLICIEAAKKNTIACLLLTLNQNDFLESRHSDSFEGGLPRFLVRSLMVVHNLMQQCGTNADAARALGGEPTLRRYFDSRNNIIALNALLAYTHMVPEPKGNELRVSEALIRHVRSEMPLKLARVRTHLGEYFLAGMCAYLARLVRCCDSFGQALIANNVLDFLAAILSAASPPPGANTAKLHDRQSGRDYSLFTCEWALTDEKKKALVVCLALATANSCAAQNVAAMRSHDLLPRALEACTSINATMKEMSNSVLLRIRRPPPAKSEVSALTPTVILSPVTSCSPSLSASTACTRCGTPDCLTLRPSAPVPTSGSGSGSDKLQLVLIYCSEYKPQLVQDVADALKAQGCSLWSLQDAPQDDVSQNWQLAIDNAEAVIFCYSEALYDNKACHVQVSYACTTKKFLIPIRLQHFKPRGWLGVILSTRSCVDLTKLDLQKDVLDAKVKLIIESIMGGQLQQRGVSKSNGG